MNNKMLKNKFQQKPEQFFFQANPNDAKLTYLKWFLVLLAIIWAGLLIHEFCSCVLPNQLQRPVDYLLIGGMLAFLGSYFYYRIQIHSIQKMNSFTQLLVQTIPFGMDIIDEEGNILYLNEQLKTLLGKETVDRKCWMAYRNLNRQCDNCCLKTISGKNGESGVTQVVLEGRIFQLSLVRMNYRGKNSFLRVFNDITELKLSESKYRQLFNSANDAVFLIKADKTGMPKQFLEVNDLACNKLGYTKGELLALSPIDLLSTKSKQKISAIREKFLNNKQITFEIGLIAKNGSEIFFEISSNLFILNDTQVEFAIARDITKRKRAAQQLIDSRDFYLTLFNEFPALIWRSGLDAKFDYFNKSWLEFTGRSIEQELEDGWAHGVHPDDLNRCLEIYLTSFKTRKPFNMEYRLRRFDGEYRWILDYGRPYYDLEGNFAGYIGSCYDFTVRKQAEESLRESEIKFRTLTETTPSAIFIYDHSGLIYVNRAAEAITGYQSDELLRGNLKNIIHRDHWRRVIKNALARMKGSFKPSQYEIKIITKTGVEKWVALSVGWINLNGKSMVLGTAFDITDLKSTEEQLQMAREEAEKASRFKSEFLANMSHEIRTPMNGIIGMTELTLGTKVTDEQRDYLNIVKTSSDELLRIINGILDFSKIEAGKMELDDTSFELRGVIEKTVEIFALDADNKGLELACHIQPGVPNSLIGDPGRLRQVLVNLIGNALKFTEHGEVVVKTEKVGGTAVNDSNQCCLRFSVIDTGIGIPPEKLDQLFQSFSQIDGSTAKKYSGTGLGLAISKKLIEMMGGSIEVESKVGEGSTFSFTVTFKIHSQHLQPIIPRKTDLKNLPVLVIDDNNTNRLILHELLVSWGMAVTLAKSGEEGIKILRGFQSAQLPFKLLLLDSHMPLGMDGFSVAEHIRRDPAFKNTIIMMITSNTNRGDLSRYRELRIAKYLVKPIKQAELQEAIIDSLGFETGEISDDSQKMESGKEKIEEINVTSLPLKKLRILLVEDNPVNQKLAEALLTKKGWEVVMVSNGIAALEITGVEYFDLILMDVRIPELDGFETTKIIRETDTPNQYTPIIAMTAYARKEDRDKCLSSGMDEYISKPINSEELYRKIQKLTVIL